MAPIVVIGRTEAACCTLIATNSPSVSISLTFYQVWCTHHHPDHYISANPILDAFPEASFLTAPYVRRGIDKEYEEKRSFWPKVRSSSPYFLSSHSNDLVFCRYLDATRSPNGLPSLKCTPTHSCSCLVMKSLPL